MVTKYNVIWKKS